MALTITKENFEQEVLKSDLPVLVDFWAAWCGPCKMVAPVIEELSEELAETVKVGKLNVDEESELAAQYGVMSIPTMIVFKNGEVAGQAIGARGKEELKELFDL